MNKVSNTNSIKFTPNSELLLASLEQVKLIKYSYSILHQFRDVISFLISSRWASLKGLYTVLLILIRE
jgi:hypothetical protein